MKSQPILTCHSPHTTIICCCDDDMTCSALRQRLCVLETLAGLVTHKNVEEACLVIQSVWKGRLGRKKYAFQCQRRDLMRELQRRIDSVARRGAAQKIQSFLRGRLVRAKPVIKLLTKYNDQKRAVSILQALSLIRFEPSSYPSDSEKSFQSETSSEEESLDENGEDPFLLRVRTYPVCSAQLRTYIY